MSSFGQVVISQNELNLLGSVEKWITLKPGSHIIVRIPDLSKALNSIAFHLQLGILTE